MGYQAYYKSKPSTTTYYPILPGAAGQVDDSPALIPLSRSSSSTSSASSAPITPPCLPYSSSSMSIESPSFSSAAAMSKEGLIDPSTIKQRSPILIMKENCSSSINQLSSPSPQQQDKRRAKKAREMIGSSSSRQRESNRQQYAQVDQYEQQQQQQQQEEDEERKKKMMRMMVKKTIPSRCRPQQDGWQMNDDGRYQLLHRLGSGACGEVYAATDLSTQRRVAIKKITGVFRCQRDALQTLREIHLLAALGDNPHVVNLIDILLPQQEKEEEEEADSMSVVGREEEEEDDTSDEDNDDEDDRSSDSSSPFCMLSPSPSPSPSCASTKGATSSSFDDIYLVLEYYESDLAKLLYSPQVLSDAHVQYFLHRILLALQHLQASHIFHRDLKPANILINGDCSLKLCDLGLGRVYVPTPQAASRQQEASYLPTASVTSKEEEGSYLPTSSVASKEEEGSFLPTSSVASNEKEVSYLPTPAASMEESYLPTPAASTEEGYPLSTKGEEDLVVEETRALHPHVVTRWYRAPELVLLQDDQEAIDMWSIGCIAVELLGKLSAPQPPALVHSSYSYPSSAAASTSARQTTPPAPPLFPGDSCFSLSPTSASDPRWPTRKDQLKTILEIIGRPSEKDKEGMVLTEPLKQYIDYACKHLPPPSAPPPPAAAPAVVATAATTSSSNGGSTCSPLYQKVFEAYPYADPQGLDLIDRMLRFNPRDRIKVKEALQHPYFKNLQEEDDPTTTPTSPSNTQHQVPLPPSAFSSPISAASQHYQHQYLQQTEQQHHSQYQQKQQIKQHEELSTYPSSAIQWTYEDLLLLDGHDGQGSHDWRSLEIIKEALWQEIQGYQAIRW